MVKDHKMYFEHHFFLHQLGALSQTAFATLNSIEDAKVITLKPKRRRVAERVDDYADYGAGVPIKLCRSKFTTCKFIDLISINQTAH